MTDKTRPPRERSEFRLHLAPLSSVSQSREESTSPLRRTEHGDEDAR